MEKQAEIVIDVLERMRRKLKTDRKLRKKRSISMGMGRLRLFKCDSCNLTVCSANYSNGKKFCDCGREMYMIFAPTFRKY